MTEWAGDYNFFLKDMVNTLFHGRMQSASSRCGRGRNRQEDLWSILCFIDFLGLLTHLITSWAWEEEQQCTNYLAVSLLKLSQACLNQEWEITPLMGEQYVHKCEQVSSTTWRDHRCFTFECLKLNHKCFCVCVFSYCFPQPSSRIFWGLSHWNHHVVWRRGNAPLPPFSKAVTGTHMAGRKKGQLRR